MIAVPAVAPPPELSPAQLLKLYEAAHAQKLTVATTAATTKITHAPFSATAGIQSLANDGTNYDWAKLVLLEGGWPQSDNNVTVLLRWMRQENGAATWWNRDNPLNNSYGAPGAGGTGRNSTLIVAAENAAQDVEARAREAITVQGNRRVDVDTVRSYFHPTTDGRFDEAARDAALKALLATNLFDKVTIDRVGERLVVHLTEAPLLDKVAFEGNKKIKDADLTAAIESKPRGTLQHALVQSDVGRILEAYRHAGRDDVSVKPEIIDRGNDRVDLVYVVTEGAKTTVRQIEFAGNKAFGNRQLGAVIKTSATSLISFLTSNDVYDPDRVDGDRELLRLYYRSKGYADASVPEAKAEYDSARHGFTLTFSIDEGPLYHFGDISLVCDVPGLDPQKL